jgi:hypothetical protein
MATGPPPKVLKYSIPLANALANVQKKKVSTFTRYKSLYAGLLRSCCLRALATASVAFIRPSSVPWLPGAGGGRLGRRRSRRHKRAKLDRNKSITTKKNMLFLL